MHAADSVSRVLRICFCVFTYDGRHILALKETVRAVFFQSLPLLPPSFARLRDFSNNELVKLPEDTFTDLPALTAL